MLSMMLNKLGQEMPMQTIVMIIIVLLVLAGVGVFFFTQFSTGKSGASSAQCIQLCQSIRTQMMQNSSITWDIVTPTAATTTGAAKEFCTSAACDGFSCSVRTSSGGPIDGGTVNGASSRCPANV